MCSPAAEPARDLTPASKAWHFFSSSMSSNVCFLLTRPRKTADSRECHAAVRFADRSRDAAVARGTKGKAGGRLSSMHSVKTSHGGHHRDRPLSSLGVAFTRNVYVDAGVVGTRRLDAVDSHFAGTWFDVRASRRPRSALRPHQTQHVAFARRQAGCHRMREPVFSTRQTRRFLE